MPVKIYQNSKVVSTLSKALQVILLFNFTFNFLTLKMYNAAKEILILFYSPTQGQN